MVAVINIPIGLEEDKHRKTYQIRENELEILLWMRLPNPSEPFEVTLPLAWGRDWAEEVKNPMAISPSPLKGLKCTLLKSQCSANEGEKPQLYTKWVKERKISLYCFQGEYHFQSQFCLLQC